MSLKSPVKQSPENLSREDKLFLDRLRNGITLFNLDIVKNLYQGIIFWGLIFVLCFLIALSQNDWHTTKPSFFNYLIYGKYEVK